MNRKIIGLIGLTLFAFSQNNISLKDKVIDYYQNNRQSMKMKLFYTVGGTDETIETIRKGRLKIISQSDRMFQIKYKNKSVIFYLENDNKNIRYVRPLLRNKRDYLDIVELLPMYNKSKSVNYKGCGNIIQNQPINTDKYKKYSLTYFQGNTVNYIYHNKETNLYVCYKVRNDNVIPKKFRTTNLHFHK